MIQKIKVNNFLGTYTYFEFECKNINIFTGKTGIGKSTVLKHISNSLPHNTDTELNANTHRQIVEYGRELLNNKQVSEIDTTFHNSPYNYKINTVLSPTDYYWERVNIWDILNQYIDAIKNYPNYKQLKANLMIWKGIVLELFPNINENEVWKLETMQATISTGQYRLLHILTSALVLSSSKNPVLVIDDAELGLDIKWQNRLIDDILKLCPHVQLFIATHSATLFNLKYEEFEIDLDELITVK